MGLPEKHNNTNKENFLCKGNTQTIILNVLVYEDFKIRILYCFP